MSVTWLVVRPQWTAIKDQKVLRGVIAKDKVTTFRESPKAIGGNLRTYQLTHCITGNSQSGVVQ